MRRRTAYQLLAGVLIAVVVAAGSLLTPEVADARRPGNVCVRNKVLQQWNNLAQMTAHGFIPELYGDEAGLTFVRERGNHYLALDLIPSGDLDADYAASRITEIDTTAPLGERIMCWQPTSKENVVAEFEVRFDQPATPGLTENLVFWNAPFDGSESLPITTIGVSRSLSTGGVYAAVVAQDLVLAPEFSGLMEVSPMPDWLDDTDWHTVRITITTTSALIEVAQGQHGFTPVLQTTLLRPPDPLGFEFSIDNEALPGMYIPVQAPDGVDVSFFQARLTK